ncbi:MAG: hypothetical protein WC343_03090 [Bacilli bacterium]|jgi:hypothetical protein
MTTVTLTLTEEQADTLLAALDIYSRLKMGQFSAVTDLFPARHFDRTAAAAALKEARQAVMPELDPRGYYGIRNLEAGEQARVAFDVQQVLRHALAWHRYPEGGIGVCFN